MKNRFISILLLLGLLWNSAFGISDGLLLNFSDCVDQCIEECGCTFDEGCESVSIEDCCYDVHMHFNADKISELRIQDDSERFSSKPNYSILNHFFDHFTPSVALSGYDKYIRGNDTLYSIAINNYVLRTIVLRV